MKYKNISALTSALSILILCPGLVRACACGCGIFEVGTGTMLPEGKGGLVYFEYDFQDQNINYNGSSRAPAENNNDKEIRTSFFTAGFQYMFDRSWGIQAELPIDYRNFRNGSDALGGQIVSNNWASLGDIRVQGIYTGFFPDMSAGLTFGSSFPPAITHTTMRFTTSTATPNSAPEASTHS
jgi:hypothetical protein